MVLSEMYYPQGWTAYIDGTETETFKTNFAFRSVIVPAGEHIVEFKFASKQFEIGRTLSTTTNIVVIILLGISL